MNTIPGELPRREKELQELNEWVAWLESWADAPPGYKTEGPMETTRGIRRLANFLRGIAYGYPSKWASRQRTPSTNSRASPSVMGSSR